MRTLDVSDGLVSASTPTGGSTTQNSLAAYADDAAFVSGKGSAATDGDVYYNTGDDLVRVYENGGWVYQVDESTAQTLSNKSLTSPNISGLKLAINPTASASNFSLATVYDLELLDSTIAAFTATLPPASDGKKFYRLKKVSTDLNACTVAPQGSDTIVDNTTGLASTSLNTFGEEVDLVSDGVSQWYVSRKIPSINASISPTPNNFGTVSNASCFGRRVGDSLIVRGQFRAGTTAAAIASISLPAGYVIDSAKFSALGNQKVGWFLFVASAGGSTAIISAGFIGVIFYDGSDTAKLYLTVGTGSNVYGKTNANGLTSTGNDLDFEFTVPISGWKG